jgi:cytoskeletal protein CcmA (bactofilin family)
MALLSKDRDRDLERPAARTGEVRTGDLSVITKDVRIVGDVETTGRLRLEGAVTGSVRANSIELTSTGSVDGDVTALSREDDKETFVIEGKVKGAVRARHVEVGEGGAVLGGLEAEQATIRGRIQGGVQARHRLALKATAVVEGDIDARRLGLEEGGQVNGNIRIGDRAALQDKTDAAPAAGKTQKGAASMPGVAPNAGGVDEPEKARVTA